MPNKRRKPRVAKDSPPEVKPVTMASLSGRFTVSASPEVIPTGDPDYQPPDAPSIVTNAAALTGSTTNETTQIEVELVAPRPQKRVAIVGFCESSRNLVPYDDPTIEIWGLNRGYIFMPRADRWFDMHSPEILSEQLRRPGQHGAFLKKFAGPVYMHVADPEIPNAVTFPLKQLAEFFGQWSFRVGFGAPGAARRDGTSSGGAERQYTPDALASPDLKLWDTRGAPYLSSSIAYEIALAIYEGYDEIHVYGVDLNTSGEYAWQKAGVEHMLGFAMGRGIRVVLPDNCPLLMGTLYGRGFLRPEGEKMSFAQMKERLESLEHQRDVINRRFSELVGAARELQFHAQQMTPGLDHENMEGRRKAIEQAMAQERGSLHETVGALKETLYWIHQTPEGQEPADAIAQIEAQVAKYDAENGELVDEGPQSPIDVVPYVEPAPQPASGELVLV